MYNVLKQLLEMYPKEEWITIQGETYGAGVQKRDYSMKDHDLAVFNVIFSTTGRMNSIDMKNLMDEFGIPCVPILVEKININQFADVDAILAYADGNSVIDGKPREGIVFRSEDGARSFKAVSNSFLLKYHQ
jgi:ATP-dependent RNA circularization protein (DNA/RNA ligase family)